MKNSEVNQPALFNPNNFSMSKAAINHFKQSLSSMDPNLGIRFSVVETSGCSGYTYALDFVKKENLTTGIAFIRRDTKILKI